MLYFLQSPTHRFYGGGFSFNYWHFAKKSINHRHTRLVTGDSYPHAKLGQIIGFDSCAAFVAQLSERETVKHFLVG